MSRLTTQLSIDLNFFFLQNPSTLVIMGTKMPSLKKVIFENVHKICLESLVNFGRTTKTLQTLCVHEVTYSFMFKM